MFEDYLELYIDYMFSVNRSETTTIPQYKKEIEIFIDFLREKGLRDIKEVETIHIDLYQSKLMKINRSSSVAKKIYAIKSFFKYLHKRKYIVENPTDALETIKIKDSDRKKKATLTKEEAMKLITKTEENSIPSMRLKNKNLMIAFLFFGLRVSELCDLKTEDLDFKGKTLYINDGKGGKNREVPLFDELIPSFKEYLKTKEVKSEYFFTTKRTERPMQPRAVLDLVKRHAKMARIKKDIGCHSLRRTAATILLEAGLSIRKIQLFLGHSSINTTMLYLDPDMEKTKQEIREKNPLAKELKKMNKKKK